MVSLARTQANHSVLVVDDDPQARRLMVRLLEKLGIEAIYEASSGQQALECLSTIHPAIVITDMEMEHDRAGLKVAERAKQAGAAVAVLSGLDLRHDAALQGVRLLIKGALSLETVGNLLHELELDAALK
jgi:CheY-like chemotaxis protein